MEILGILGLAIFAILCIRDLAEARAESSGIFKRLNKKGCAEEEQRKKASDSSAKKRTPAEYSSKIDYVVQKEGGKTYFEIAGKSQTILPFLYTDEDGEDNWFPPDKEFLEKQEEQENSIRAAYKVYLKSDRWQKIRAIVLKRADYICERCKNNRAVQVHHAQYPDCFKRGIFIERENLSHLTALCDKCHAEIHHRDNPPSKGCGSAPIPP